MDLSYPMINQNVKLVMLRILMIKTNIIGFQKEFVVHPQIVDKDLELLMTLIINVSLVKHNLKLLV